MRKLITVNFLTIILFFTFILNVFAQGIRLQDINSEKKDEQLIVNFIFDKPAELISYALSKPPRVVLEPVDEVFSNLNDFSFNSELASNVELSKTQADKITSIVIELKQDVPYYLVNNNNMVSVVLSPQVEEKTEGQSEEGELKKMRELNKLIAPTRVPILREEEK